MSEIKVNSISSLNGANGPVISGIATMVSSGAMTLPRGDTTYRGGRGRGIWAGGSNGAAYIKDIQYVTIATTGDALDFGDMITGSSAAASSSSTRAVVFQGLTPSLVNTIEYFTISSTGNSFDFGDATVSVHETASASNNTRGLNAGGYSSGSGVPANTQTIDYVTIANTGNATDFGDLAVDGSSGAMYGVAGVSNGTLGVFGGGRNGGCWWWRCLLTLHLHLLQSLLLPHYSYNYY